MGPTCPDKQRADAARDVLRFEGSAPAELDLQCDDESNDMYFSSTGALFDTVPLTCSLSIVERDQPLGVPADRAGSEHDSLSARSLNGAVCNWLTSEI